jgi:hypothetical protein
VTIPIRAEQRLLLETRQRTNDHETRHAEARVKTNPEPIFQCRQSIRPGPQSSDRLQLHRVDVPLQLRFGILLFLAGSVPSSSPTTGAYPLFLRRDTWCGGRHPHWKGVTGHPVAGTRRRLTLGDVEEFA